MNSKQKLVKSIYKMADVIEANKEYLTELDSPIGDADHGFNMTKGFKMIRAKLEDVENEDCGTILKTVAMTLISTVGGASGPLYGTAFLKAAGVVQGKHEIGHDDLVKMFDEAIQGIVMRGKAKIGDKTMLDALYPALEALKLSLDNGDSTAEAFTKAQAAALEGVEFTKTIIAKKGRASYLGERSLGHQDPGATSSWLLLGAIVDTLEGA
jgi:dihydroxyacetone kinase-like protein